MRLNCIDGSTQVLYPSICYTDVYYKIQTYFFFRQNCEWMRYTGGTSQRWCGELHGGRRATQNGDKQPKYIRDSDDVEIIWLRAAETEPAKHTTIHI